MDDVTNKGRQSNEQVLCRAQTSRAYLRHKNCACRTNSDVYGARYAGDLLSPGGNKLPQHDKNIGLGVCRKSRRITRDDPKIPTPYYVFHAYMNHYYFFKIGNKAPRLFLH